PHVDEVSKSATSIQNATKNLDKCLSNINFSFAPESRYKTAQQLRLKGLFAEAGYEFAQSVESPKYKGSAYEQLGDMMKVLGNVEKVSYYYEKALQVIPNDPELRLKYARALDKEGKGELALEEYNYALQSGDNDPETLYSLERIYRQKLLQNEQDAVALTNLGAILQKQNKIDEALNYYQLANKYQPENVQNRMNMGSLYFQKKNYDKAYAMYDSILIEQPNNINANLYKGQCLAALNEVDEAKESFKKVMSLAPKDNKIKSQIVESLKDKVTPDEIISFVYADSTPQKGDVDNLYNYAFNLHKQNKFDKAIETYKTVVKHNPNNPEVYVNLAIAYNQNKEFEKAQEVIKIARGKFPGNKQVIEVGNSIAQESASRLITQAGELYNAKDYAGALNVYLSVMPQTFDSLVGVASCYNAQDDYLNAVLYYKKALEKKPNADIAYYIASLYTDKGEYANAKTYLTRALTLDANHQNAKELLSYVNGQENAGALDKGIKLYEATNYLEAINVFNGILKQDSKNAYAYYYRASAYDAQKKYAQAIEDYKKAVMYNAEFGIANYLIAVDYDTLGQYKDALSYYKKYVQSTSEVNDYTTYSKQRIEELKSYE
ncbi:tetratricopeptide repeat protein, partial [bacterium]|nr:tetratricopeptide repeat protein [bacterium]